MTREEQLDWLYRLKSEIYVYMPKEWLIPMNNALDMTIKALEQEPILDKIRAIVDEWQSDTWTDNLSYECMVKIAELVETQESEDK